MSRVSNPLSILFVLMVTLGISGCASDLRNTRPSTKSDLLPSYIAAPPLGDSIGVLIDSTSNPNAGGVPGILGDGPDVSMEVAAFRVSLLKALQSRGYRAVDLGKPHTVCSGFDDPLCYPEWERGEAPRLRALMLDQGLAAALVLQLRFRPEATLPALEGGAEIKAKTVHINQYLLDQSGLLLRAGGAPLRRAGEKVGRADPDNPDVIYATPWIQAKRAGMSAAGKPVYVLKTPREWGEELAARYVERNMPPFVPNAVASVSDIERVLLAHHWILDWRYNEGKANSKGPGSGSHVVAFERRGDVVIAQIGADAALGIGPTEAPITVTPVGVTYLIPGLGRVRMTFDRRQSRFDGKVFVLTQAVMQKLSSLTPSDEPIFSLANVSLRPLR